jgi:tetratricopeptide (TPR) repeat protein
MENDTGTHDQPNGRTENDVASIDAESLVTALEKSLRNEPRPSPEAEAEIRARLLRLYLAELRDPLSAAVHAEALLDRETVDRAVLDSVAALVEHRPIAARMAEKLSAAYARVGEVASELGMLSKELSLARPPRLDVVKRRLADLHFGHLDDADGALDLLEPLIQRTTADDALRARYLEIAASSDGGARAIRTLMRASRAEKDAGARARILSDLGELYLKEGDLRRARQAFLGAVEGAGPGPEGLAAARHLLHLEPEPGDPKVVGAALAVVARIEPDRALRRAAAERLLGLPGTSTDDDRAIIAWRTLVDSPRGAEALDKLSELLEKRNDVVGLVEVLRAREPSRDALARLVPILEKGGLWKELAETLERQAEIVPADESAAVLSRLGRVRMSRLGDGEGAMTAFRGSLEVDPKNAMARTALENMMSKGAHRTQAAHLLELVYRAEGLADGIARVLSTRAEISTSPAEKLSALDRAFEAARTAALPRSRLLSLAQAGLGEAARHDPRTLPVWLSRFRELTAESNDPSRDADILTLALGGRAVDGPELADLACAAFDALLASGKADHARAFCAAALSSAPGSTDLLQRYDRIVGTGEPSRERLGRYQAALDRTADPGERRRIMQVLATICREDLDDLPRAIELWQHILRDDPKDLDALLGLFSAYERLGNSEALFAEIEDALVIFEGEQRQAVLLRKASALSKFGEREQSSELRGKLLEQPNLPSSIVESILTAAYEDDQPEVYRQALEIQANAEDPAVRMRALERLGDFHFEQLGDRRAAIDSWKPAARLYTAESPEDEHARELYERVLEASPDDREAALRLVELYAKAGEWARVPEVYGALLRSEGGVEAAIAKLLGLERDATDAGAVDEYVSMVDETVPRLGTPAGESRYRLIQAKARILSADPARQSDASAAHKQVIESFGSESDIEAFATFIESRGSADDRQADLRWLFEFRASRAQNPLELLSEWAKVEEEYGDVESAIRVYDRILERAPGGHEALEALARLKRASGDFEGCLAALRALRDGAEPKRAADLDLSMARLLGNELERPLDAALAIAPCLRGSRHLNEAVDIARRALSLPEARARAIEIVELASRDASPDAAAENLRLLVEEAGSDDAVSESSRSSWYERLIELRSDDLDAALELAKEGVRDLPNSRPLWEVLDRLARRADRPDLAAEAYRGAMGRGMLPELADAIGGRMVQLLDESSSDSEEVLRTLEQILEHVPRARWALDRVKLVLSAQGRWEELFELYDRAIENAASEGERAGLLDEAGFAARDLARAPDRAIAFLETLLELRPADAPVQAALERLYERGGKTEKLIELLSARAESMTGVARLEVSHRIASARLDLGDVDSAAKVVDGMLERGASVDDVKDVLEQMIAMSGDERPGSRARRGVTERAISLLSAHYAAAGLTHELIGVTRTALSLSRDPAERARCAKDLVRMHLEVAAEADDAFASTRAAVKADLGDDPALAEVAARALLDEATKDWERRGGGRTPTRPVRRGRRS